MDNILTITVEIYRHKVFLSGMKGGMENNKL